MSKRNNRIINAFSNCVKSGEYSLDYAILLIEDTSKYGYLTEEDKEVFYNAFPEDESPEAEHSEDNTEE